MLSRIRLILTLNNDEVSMHSQPSSPVDHDPSELPDQYQDDDDDLQLTAFDLLQRAVGVVVLALALIGGWFYPSAPLVLIAALLAYSVVLWVWPFASLLVLPLVLPVLNLAPWSGRLLIEEFDLILLVTVALGCWHGFYGRKSFHIFHRPAVVLISLLTLSYLISLVIGLLPWQPFDANAWTSYLSHYNSLRIGRGFFWALALLPILLYAVAFDRETAFRLLTTGFIAGLVAVGIVVLWERGVFATLISGRGFYALINSVLDFTSEYRITALFSEMHTGGSAVDGYIAIAWPFALGALLLYGQRLSYAVLGSAAFGAGAYIAVVTYTRITYAAFAVSLLVFVIGLGLSGFRRLSARQLLEPVALLIITLALLVYGYQRGGGLTLIAALILFGTAALAVYCPPTIRWPVWAVSALLGGGLAISALMTSKWQNNSLIGAGLLTVVLIVVLLPAGFRFAQTLKPVTGLPILLTVLFMLSAGSTIIIPAVSGVRMEARFSTVDADLTTRTGHWRDVLRSSGDGALRLLFGNGLGSFPRYYAWNNSSAWSIGSYAIGAEGSNQYLSLGGGSDLEVGQRLDVAVGATYRLRLDIRSRDSESRLRVRLCRRNLLDARNCERDRTSLVLPGSRWQTLELPIETDSLGSGPGWPVGLFIRNQRQGSVIDIDNVELIDSYGINRLDNGSFRDGMDHWFSYNEFSHLPWHTKSLWLHLWSEQGLFGMLVFAVLILYVAGRTITTLIEDPLMMLTLASALVGFMVVGVTGSLLDAPRIAVLFYMLLFTLLLMTFEPWESDD